MITSPVIFGEVLFDCFPDGDSVLGGAPFNVAWHLQGFGLHPRFVSCVGDDDLGHAVKSAMTHWGMSIESLQVCRDKPTGAVKIQFDNGEPRYEICADQAYDNISLTPDLEIAMAECGMFYYGSLAARTSRNFETLNTLLKIQSNAATTNYLMDANLRPPWWRQDRVSALASAADWVKLNEHELRLLAKISTEQADIVELARNYLETNQLQGLIVTQGKQGAFILNGSEVISAATPQVANFVNPVGAGDAFTAAFILGYLREWSLSTCLQRAQQFAALVCEAKAAIIHDRLLYQRLLEQWSE